MGVFGRPEGTYAPIFDLKAAVATRCVYELLSDSRQSIREESMGTRLRDE